MCTYSTEDIQNNQKVENASRGNREYFPGFLAFRDCTEQQIPRPANRERRKIFYSSGKKKRHTTVKNQITVNNHRGYILHK